MTPYDTLTLAIEDGVALLTLNDPERLNAVSYQMITDLNVVMDEIEAPASGTRLPISRMSMIVRFTRDSARSINFLRLSRIEDSLCLHT